MHLGLEYSAWHAVKSDLCIIPSHDPLQGILIECPHQTLIVLTGIDERHGGSKLRRNDVHTWSQGDLCHKTRTHRPDRGLIEIELGIGKLGTQLCDRGINTTNVRSVGEPCALL